jgi:hypothetical protein
MDLYGFLNVFLCGMGGLHPMASVQESPRPSLPSSLFPTAVAVAASAANR